MRHHRFVLAATGVVSTLYGLDARAQSPRRDVADPGVIATDQRITPAGVQTVFNGRVTGVQFSSPSTLWVVVPGNAYHVSWSDNQVIARGRYTRALAWWCPAGADVGAFHADAAD